jgi:hypothetical protein
MTARQKNFAGPTSLRFVTRSIYWRSSPMSMNGIIISSNIINPPTRFEVRQQVAYLAPSSRFSGQFDRQTLRNKRSCSRNRHV